MQPAPHLLMSRMHRSQLRPVFFHKMPLIYFYRLRAKYRFHNDTDAPAWLQLSMQRVCLTSFI